MQIKFPFFLLLLYNPLYHWQVKWLTLNISLHCAVMFLWLLPHMQLHHGTHQVSICLDNGPSYTAKAAEWWLKEHKEPKMLTKSPNILRSQCDRAFMAPAEQTVFMEPPPLKPQDNFLVPNIIQSPPDKPEMVWCHKSFFQKQVVNI